MRKVAWLALLLVLVAGTAFGQPYGTDLILTDHDGIWTDVRAHSSLAAAISTIGSHESTLLISEEVTSDDLTIPANVKLRFTGPGMISANAGQTVALETRWIEASDRTIFTGDGNFDFADGTRLRALWFDDIDTAIAKCSHPTLDKVTLVITSPETLATTQAVGDNTCLEFTSYSILTVPAGIALSNIHCVEAGKHQIFAGAGDFDFASGTELRVAWFLRPRTAMRFVDDDDVGITLVFEDVEYLDQDTTFDEYITLKFTQGGQMSINGGVTATINGGIVAEPTVIFPGNGDVTGTPRVEFGYAEWLGAVPEDSTVDSGVFINEALAMFQQVKLLPFDYYLDTGLVIDSNYTLQGAGAKITRLRPGPSFVQDGFLVTFGSASTCTGAIIRDLSLYDDRSDTRSAVRLKDCDGVSRLLDVSISNFDGYGIKGELCFDFWIDNVSVTGCGSSTDSLPAVYIGHDSVYDPSNVGQTWANYVSNSWKVKNFKVGSSYYTTMHIDDGAYNLDFVNVKLHPRYDSSLPNANVLEIEGHMNSFSNLQIATASKTAIKITRSDSGITAIDDRVRNFLSGSYNEFNNVQLTGNQNITNGVDQYIYIEGGTSNNRQAAGNQFIGMAINVNQASMPDILQSGANGWIDIGGTNGRAPETLIQNATIRTHLDPSEEGTGDYKLIYISSDNVTIRDSFIYGDWNWLVYADSADYFKFQNNYLSCGSDCPVGTGNVQNFIYSDGDYARVTDNSFAETDAVNPVDVSGIDSYAAFNSDDVSRPRGRLSRNLGDLNSTGIGAEDLRDYTIQENTLGITRAIKLTAAGTVAGTTGTKKVYLHWGTQSFLCADLASGDTTDWWCEGWIFNSGTAAQRIWWQGVESDGTRLEDFQTATEDTTADVVVKTSVDAVDTITQYVWWVEILR